MKLSDAAGEIFSGLLDLTREGGPGNFMVVSSGDIYVQFAGSPGNPQVVCESISNEYLPDNLRIPQKAVDKLKKMGFVLGGDQIENFSCTFDLKTEAQARKIANLTLRILREVYGLKPAADLQIEVSLE